MTDVGSVGHRAPGREVDWVMRYRIQDTRYKIQEMYSWGRGRVDVVGGVRYRTPGRETSQGKNGLDDEIQDTGYRIQDTRCNIRNAICKIQDTRNVFAKCKNHISESRKSGLDDEIQDTGYKIQDTRCNMQDTRYKRQEMYSWGEDE